MQVTKQITELSPLCAALISMLDEMLQQEHRSAVVFHKTALGAFARLEEMRAVAADIPCGLRQDMAYELISHHSSCLNRMMMRHLTAAMLVEKKAEETTQGLFTNYMATVSQLIQMPQASLSQLH